MFVAASEPLFCYITEDRETRLRSKHKAYVLARQPKGTDLGAGGDLSRDRLLATLSYLLPRTWREWSRAGILQGFIIALYAEICGCPLTIYVLT